jgi:hypothetical protein
MILRWKKLHEGKAIIGHMASKNENFLAKKKLRVSIL